MSVYFLGFELSKLKLAPAIQLTGLQETYFERQVYNFNLKDLEESDVPEKDVTFK